MIVSCASIHVACVLGKWSAGAMAEGKVQLYACNQNQPEIPLRSVGEGAECVIMEARFINWRIARWHPRNSLMNMDLHLRLDEHDLERARLLSGIGDLAALVQHVLREFVHMKAALDLIRLRGSAPDLKGPPWPRPPDSENRPIAPDLED
jgi:hypothetical protein